MKDYREVAYDEVRKRLALTEEVIEKIQGIWDDNVFWDKKLQTYTVTSSGKDVIEKFFKRYREGR